MAEQDKVVETTNKETVNTENTNKNTDLTSVMEMVEHYKQESVKKDERIAYLEREAKSAYAKRDKTSKMSDNPELLQYLEKLETERDNYKKVIEDSERERVRSKKTQALQDVFVKQGLLPQYASKVSVLADLDSVDLEKAPTINYQVDKVRTEFPHLFANTGQEVDKSLPSPRLAIQGNSVEVLKQQFQEEARKGLATMNLNKVNALAEQLVEKGINPKTLL